MSARTAMLADIRSNLAKSAPFEALYHHLQPSTRLQKPSVSNVSSTDLADQFATELSAVGGEVYRSSNEEQAIDLITGTLGEIGAKRVAISDMSLRESKAFEGIDLIQDPSREELFAVDAGISTAQLAIAETGTLVLRSSMETHRLVSLVPPVHICVLNTANIKLSMSDVLEELSSKIDPTITFITGPSRTSDIELTLAIGVHGPKRLIVILID
ncbi:MAG: lactate utilization protein [Pyrinomonadaceae bacterium]